MAFWFWSVPPDNYPVYAKTGTFAVRRNGKGPMQAIRPGDRIFAYLPGSRVIAGLFEATTAAFEDETSLVRGGGYPHRVRVRALAELNEEARVPYEAFAGKLTVLDEYDADDPDRQFRAVAQRVVHRLPEIDGRLLEFLVSARLGTDTETLIASLDRYRHEQETGHARAETVQEAAVGYAPPSEHWNRAEALEDLIGAVEARGFVYQPWQIAAYVTALRTKPFVILAGVTGVGKSRLPVLVAEATGGSVDLLPVRPDWTDSAEVLGYEDLQGRFRPGALLAAAQDAADDPGRHHVAVLDEMNLARPEHYLAEVLSRIEGRRAVPHGWASGPLVPRASDAAWRDVVLPPNLGLVGTVNMDESAHSFSRKVLDRAFTLELSDIALDRWQQSEPPEAVTAAWPVGAWQPRALTLGGLGDLDEREREIVDEAVTALAQADALLAPVGFGLGYRMRDETALFALCASETPDAFRTRDGAPVDPLDLALSMKLLPRLAGGSRSLRRALFSLLGWALGEPRLRSEDDAREHVERWERSGRPVALTARYPRTAARLALMTDRLLSDGFATYWE